MLKSRQESTPQQDSALQQEPALQQQPPAIPRQPTPFYEPGRNFREEWNLVNSLGAWQYNREVWGHPAELEASWRTKWTELFQQFPEITARDIDRILDHIATTGVGFNMPEEDEDVVVVGERMMLFNRW